ncbi:hypothetical protein L484_012480 [Morus notabilis]|uniref:Cytochrome b561 and DOMON domain-containing protein n=1 Tax=Morus notabilis TaxID=981085 RepID=W9R0S9_9ROSA|nr:cytochrome b561 and DOMON domain-containing protein At4g12980 [Morus notabilis]EXB63290.1 hypothetical protein L484_012480 [Morus notabilis]
MFSSTKLVCFSLAFLSLLFTIEAYDSCTDQFHDLTLKRNLKNCKKLATLGAEFGWNHHIESQNKSILVDILFGVPQDAGIKWIAWGVNPGNRPQMVGTRAIIGIVQNNGTLSVNKYNVTTHTKLGCELLPSKIEIDVRNLTGETSNSSGYITFSARLDLDPSVYNVEMLNHVWQVGYDADQEALEPKMHPPNLQNFDSTETINMTVGEGRSIGHHHRHLRMVHGIVNIVGWGTLLPIGVILARYFRSFPVKLERWFCLHVGCQIVGYVLGTTGWAIGLWLGRTSKHYNFHTHRLLAIFIFTFTTLQMLALRLRPKQHDDYRKYWDMYHHFLGYALLAVIAVNVFHGIGIMKPNNTWKWAYIGILGVLGLITLVLEIFTWAKFFSMDKKDTKDKKEAPDTQNQPT